MLLESEKETEKVNYKIFDAHCDTLTELLEKNETLSENSGMVRLDMLKGYSGFVQVFAAWIDAEKGNPLLNAIELADKFYEETENNGICVIKDAKTLEETVAKGGIGAILAIEDGIALCGSLRVLNMLYRLGFRLITLTWNGENELGCGAVASSGDGLTDFGKKAVLKMNELGMVVDCSHLSERGFWDLAEISKKPFLASHSNAKRICDHPRNLTDEQIITLIKTGGVMGINLYPEFLNGTQNACVKDVIRHIEHVLSLGGENSLGIGTDFDGIPTTPEGIENTAKLHVLFDEMRKIGYSEDLIEKITYKNFTKVFSECLK